MVSLVFDEDKLEAYKEQLQQARDVRRELVSDLCVALDNLLSVIEYSEERIIFLMSFFNADKLKREKATRNIKLYWSGITQKSDLISQGMKKPEWTLFDKRTTKKLTIKSPTRFQLRRILLDSVFEEACEQRDQIKYQIKEREKNAQILMKLRKVIVKGLPAILNKEANITDIDNTIPVWVEVNRSTFFFRRRELFHKFSVLLHSSLERLEAIESELDDLMLEFNSIVRRRHLSLAIRWTLNVKNGINLGSIRGPCWTQLLINMRNGNRNFKTLKTINRELIRSSGYRRHEKVVLSLYKRINRLKDERTLINSSIFRVERILRNKFKVKR